MISVSHSQKICVFGGREAPGSRKEQIVGIKSWSPHTRTLKRWFPRLFFVRIYLCKNTDIQSRKSETLFSIHNFSKLFSSFNITITLQPFEQIPLCKICKTLFFKKPNSTLSNPSDKSDQDYIAISQVLKSRRISQKSYF